MDDQQGNVIDGTARARQWRGSKSKTRSTPDDPEARSDAPKSIAGSLLVPADMLPPASPTDASLNGNAHNAAGERAPHLTTDTTDQASAENGAHQNPFLVPEAARVEHGSRYARRPRIAALLQRSLGSLGARRASSRVLRNLVAMGRRRLGAVRLSRRLALAILAGAIVLTAVIATQSNTPGRSSERAVRAATPGSLNTRGSGSLAASANPFEQQRTARDRALQRARRIRAHRTANKHRRSRHASKAAAVPARYTPPASDAGSSAPASATPSYATPGPSAAAAQPAPSSGGGTTSTSSSSTSTRPAFGQNGTLGPGHAPTS